MARFLAFTAHYVSVWISASSQNPRTHVKRVVVSMVLTYNQVTICVVISSLIDVVYFGSLRKMTSKGFFGDDDVLVYISALRRCWMVRRFDHFVFPLWGVGPRHFITYFAFDLIPESSTTRTPGTDIAVPSARALAFSAVIFGSP